MSVHAGKRVLNAIEVSKPRARRFGMAMLAGFLLAAVPLIAAAQQDAGRAPRAGPAGASLERSPWTTAEQAEMAARISYARAIVERLRPEAESNSFSRGWDMALSSRLYNRPAGDLAKMASLETYADVGKALATGARNGRATQKDHGYGTNNLVFHAIAPCRLVDTRLAVGTLPANTTRIVGMSDSSTQGGAADCSTAIRGADPAIGDNSAWGALALNVTVANTAAGPAFLRLRPVGAQATSAFLNWTAANSQVANAGIVQLADVGVEGQFEMFASSSTDVIIDVFGAFGRTRQMTCSNVYNTVDSSVNPDDFISLDDADVAACPAGSVDVGYVWDYTGGDGGLAPWQNCSVRSDGSCGLGFTHVRPSALIPGTTITFRAGRKCCSIPDVTQ